VERLRFRTPELTFTVTRCRGGWTCWTSVAGREINHVAASLGEAVAYLGGAITAADRRAGHVEAGVCDYPERYSWTATVPPPDQEYVSLSGPHGLIVLLVERCRRKWPKEEVPDPA
jgi:hypothetical protein